jgi:DNA-directed RNA polymerases I, II, and III subunit RPABC2
MDAVEDFDAYEPEEPPEDFAPDLDENALEEEVAAREGQNGEASNKTVVTGDPNAGQKKPTSENDKKIPDDKRSTTPYMTKYERARVLGTRALQIRLEALPALRYKRILTRIQPKRAYVG